MEDNVAAMFEDSSATEQISEMAEEVVLLEELIQNTEREQVKRREQLALSKTDLSNLLTQNGMESCKLESGLNPKAKIAVRVFKAAGVSDEELFGWLNDNDLAGIIKPTVHWGTLNKTLLAFEDEGHGLPGIFNKSETPTVTMYGKSKFLAAQAPSATE